MVAVKLVEQYAIASLRNDVRDSLIMGGEQAILLQLFHPVTDKAVERCPNCHDDIYEGGESDCEVCYGTTFKGGVRAAHRVYALFTDQPVSEKFSKQGVWEDDVREFQAEAFPSLIEHDIVVRVRRWDDQKRATELEGFYKVAAVTQTSLRTGTRSGQQTWDVVGQRAALAKISTVLPITRYPVLGQLFPLTTTSANNNAPVSIYNPPVTQPDVKVVFTPAEGGDVSRPFTHVHPVPETTWVIEHPLNHFPSVTVIVNGELVEPDVYYPDPPDFSPVTVIFAEPTSGVAVLV
jgi:hypothetical protein